MPKPRDERVDLVGKTSPLLEQPDPTLRKGKRGGGRPSGTPGASVSPFKKPVGKGRTYLGPGQTAPEGSEEQEGPRGGRYYEGEGGEPGGMLDPAAGTERENDPTESPQYRGVDEPEEAVWDDIAGTGFQGDLEGFSGQDLIDILGPPHYTPEPGATSKTQAEWAFKFKDGTVATIYDYKTGKSYLGEDEGQDMEETTEWHIGGKSQKATQYIKDWIESQEDRDVDEAEADTGQGPTEMEQFKGMNSSEERVRMLDGWEDDELVGAYQDIKAEFRQRASGRGVQLLHELDQEYQRRGNEPRAIAAR